MHSSQTSEKQPSAFQYEYAPLFVLLAALLFYVLRFGYNYGFSDQDEFLPFLLHRLDPSVLAQDWFVIGQASAFSIRTYFVSMLYGLAQFIPVWVVVLSFYIAAWLTLAGAVYVLCLTVTPNKLAATATVLAALVLTPQWTLGGNDLVHSMLVPSMCGWALGLWGLVLFLRNKQRHAALLLGIATWMQVLIGLQLAGLLGLILLWRLIHKQVTFQAVFLFAGIFVTVALPALAPLVYQHVGSSPSGATEESLSMFYVLAEFRVPHHYLFYSFPTRSLIRFGTLLLLGGLSAMPFIRRKPLAHRDTLFSLLLGIAGLCLFAFLGTEVWPSLFIAQLQLFKSTVLAKLIFLILICGSIAAWMPEPFSRLFERVIAFRRGGLGIVLALWTMVIFSLLMDVDVLKVKAGPLAHEGTPLEKVESWARQASPQDAIFAVPPSWSGFRSRAQRAIVVNFKAFPYRDGLNEAWFERLTQLAPLTLPDRGSPALQRTLDEAFFQLPDHELLRLTEHYNVDFVVRDPTLMLSSPFFEPVYRAADWIVYRVIPTDGPAE